MDDGRNPIVICKYRQFLIQYANPGSTVCARAVLKYDKVATLVLHFVFDISQTKKQSKQVSIKFRQKFLVETLFAVSFNKNGIKIEENLIKT